jgi:hypothetical protein
MLKYTKRRFYKQTWKSKKITIKTRTGFLRNINKALK